MSYVKKNTFIVFKYIVVTLVILIPIIKILISAQFGITLMNDVKVVYSYLILYGTLIGILIFLIGNSSFALAIIFYLCIYAGGILLTSGVGFNNYQEYTSPDKEHTLLVKVDANWGQATDIRFYEKINPYFKKFIRTPQLSGNNPPVFGVFWDEDNNPIISGDLFKANKHMLQRSKDTLGKNCDFEIRNDRLYLKLTY